MISCVIGVRSGSASSSDNSRSGSCSGSAEGEALRLLVDGGIGPMSSSESSSSSGTKEEPFRGFEGPDADGAGLTSSLTEAAAWRC